MLHLSVWVIGARYVRTLFTYRSLTPCNCSFKGIEFVEGDRLKRRRGKKTLVSQELFIMPTMKSILDEESIKLLFGIFDTF